jgi:hypothetical protein
MSGTRSPSIEVRTDLKITDLYWLFLGDAIWRATYGRWIVAMVLIVLLALRAERLVVLALFVASPLVIGMLVYFVLVRPYIRSRAFVRNALGTGETVSYLLNDRGVDVRRQNSQLHYDWPALQRAKQTSGLLLLYFEGNSALVLPKRCFINHQQLVDARFLIADRLKLKSKPRGPSPLG